MKKTRTISYLNLPTRLPMIQTIVVYLLLVHINASAVTYAIVGTVIVFIWLAVIIRLFAEERINIFRDKEDD